MLLGLRKVGEEAGGGVTKIASAGKAEVRS